MGFFEDLIASLQGFVQNEPPADWKYREDPLLGGRDRIEVSPLEQYSGPNIVDTRAKLYRNAVDGMGGTEALMGGQPESRVGFFDRLISRLPEDLILGDERRRPSPSGAPDAQPAAGDDFWSRTGLTPETVRGAAQEKIGARQQVEEEEIAREAAREAEKKRLMEAAASQNQQREFMRGTVPLIEDYDKGIAIGGMPDSGGRDEILAKIRAQALAKGGGTVGAGGGTFSQGTMTPEIQQRLAERDAWTADQPIRDAEFALTREQVERSPARASIAAQTLADMKRNKVLGQQQELQESLVNKLADGSGKIPFEQAMQLEAAGVQIPYGARGMAPEQFDAKINGVIAGSSADLDRALEAQAMGAPQEAVNMIIGFSSSVRDKAIRLDELVKSGKMKRDEANKILDEIIAREERANNAIKAFQLINPGMAVPPAGE